MYSFLFLLPDISPTKNRRFVNSEPSAIRKKGRHRRKVLPPKTVVIFQHNVIREREIAVLCQDFHIAIRQFVWMMPFHFFSSAFDVDVPVVVLIPAMG